MRLIEEINITTSIIRFYDGIDFDMIRDHTTEDFLIFFIDSWSTEVKKWERDNKINNILNNIYNDFNPSEINNNFILIYQTSGDLDLVYKTVRDRLLDKEPYFNNWKVIV